MTSITASGSPLARHAERVLRDTGYLLTGFPVAVASFVVLVTGLAAGLGLAITVVGLPVLVVTLLVARGFAELERVRLALVFDRLPRPRYPSAPPDAVLPRKLLNPLFTAQFWRDLLHGLVAFPVAVATFVLTVAWWGSALGGLTYPLWDWSVPHPPENKELPEILGLGDGPVARSVTFFVLGLMFAATLPWVMRGAALAQGWLARALLSSDWHQARYPEGTAPEEHRG